jgi:hypothetical protein
MIRTQGQDGASKVESLRRPETLVLGHLREGSPGVVFVSGHPQGWSLLGGILSLRGDTEGEPR